MNLPGHPPGETPSAQRVADSAALHPADWLARLPSAGGARFIRALRHGSMELELYAPRGKDGQEPHARDELYFVVSGHGRFERDGVITPFAAGDALFVPAFTPHRFLDFSDDFATWVVFYGPVGGEKP